MSNPSSHIQLLSTLSSSVTLTHSRQHRVQRSLTAANGIWSLLMCPMYNWLTKKGSSVESQ